MVVAGELNRHFDDFQANEYYVEVIVRNDVHCVDEVPIPVCSLSCSLSWIVVHEVMNLPINSDCHIDLSWIDD